MMYELTAQDQTSRPGGREVIATTFLCPSSNNFASLACVNSLGLVMSVRNCLNEPKRPGPSQATTLSLPFSVTAGGAGAAVTAAVRSSVSPSLSGRDLGWVLTGTGG